MKKCITFLLCLAYVSGTGLHASSFTIRVPQKFLTQKAALVLYMTDELGKPCIGTCRLDKNSASRKISRCELQMTTEQESYGDAIDLTESKLPLEHEAVLCFELDPSRVLRVLVMKDTLLEDDPFGVVEFASSEDTASIADDEEFDPLSAMVDGIDPNSLASSAEKNKSSVWEQCALYAEIVALVTYGKAKRAVSDMRSWLYDAQ